MLPFLNKHKQSVSGLIIERRKPDETPDQDESSEGDDILEAAASDILNAIEQKDSKHLALALRAAFQILDSEPHEEGPHLNEEGLE